MPCLSPGSSFCGVPLSGIPPLFWYSTVVLWCSGYSAGVPRSVVPCSGVVPPFHGCSMFCRSVFRCSWFYSMPFLRCISTFEGTSFKYLLDTVTRSFISCCFINFYINRYNFSQIFRTCSTLSEKIIFVTTFSFLMDSLKHLPTHPLNSQNLLSMTKVFCFCYL